MRHHTKIRIAYFLSCCILIFSSSYAQSNGYELWLNYTKVDDSALLSSYRSSIQAVHVEEGSETLKIIKNELQKGLQGLLGSNPVFKSYGEPENILVVLTYKNLPQKLKDAVNKENLSGEGYIIKTIVLNDKSTILVTASEDIGLLYGTFHLLRLIQNHSPLNDIAIIEAPKVDLRVLNHWDNLDRSVERGYAGFSIWNWHTLPDYIDQRYIDYARANASIGINGTVLTNVNSNALILTPHYLEKVKALSDIFRPYGIKVYLTARFSAPLEIGGLKTADPLDENVIKWWNDKVKEIYDLIPDFGGFLVKANSEGQPGPQNYGRTHLDGANLMAHALAPYKGVVMWRAFVYSEHDPTDRHKQSYSEFIPMDGKFKDNVLIQVKNGAIDFQPREPFHPMFGAMPKTPLMMEFQITKEYLGFATHLAYLPKLYEEVLKSDTYQKGKGSTVSKVIDGSLNNKKISGMAGVANIGTDTNWTGHPFGQADWYGFGRLAWNPHLDSEIIADEWLRSTFSNDEGFLKTIKKMMLESREVVVNYMNPLGLHHIFDAGHHYGPGPWIDHLPRPEWNAVYYHKADNQGIGFDRTKTGSNALAQYAPEVEKMFSSLETCPDEYLLWFHHLPWDHKLKNGRTLWDNLGIRYQLGVDQVENMIETWQQMKPHVNDFQHHQVAMLLNIQLKEAKWWRDACMLYFQTFSKMDFPKEMEDPENTLEYYKSLKFPFAPGIRPRWD
ncbi:MULTISPECIES: alpha-glucuronidase family glycosyl hydrolase [Flavobacteriaceae]|uniref:alpha-glucuronidase family glycosyl hydrolase n=1 Tax=Flavobacteriaceae TaxID=49546 RepID=UPI001490F6A2|nr:MULTISPECIES: alpha-glucuronidase family glycosyl hydrolase [Allomuricauda]MDC6366193.1 alpha-glucuronidase family glycosyl hydrolase [Muricauda sp. AC10]